MSDKVENKNFSSTLCPLPSTLLSMFLRSFLIQAGWNYERMQNLGFAFSMMPALGNIYAGAPEAFRSAVLRHLDVFNTQPYMSGFVIGNMARMEEELAVRLRSGQAGGADAEALEKNVRDIKQALASSFASIGDRIFWGRLKPLTTQLCIAVWTAAGFYGWLFTDARPEIHAAALFAGPALGMALYAAFSVYLRWQGLKRGYACGGAANCGLDMLDWRRLIRRLSLAGFFLSVAIVLAAFALLAALNRAGPPGDLALKIGLVLSVLALHRLGRKFGRSVFFAVGLILAVSMLLFGALRLPAFYIL